MFRSSLYYRLKPYLPRTVRMTIRGWVSRRKRAKVGHIWPICPGSEKPPIGWQGWPDGKQFAFVLTHDVEGPAGLANCRRLMELEMKLGFRSSFNFIPAGSYQVPDDLREELVRNGFEVGVHDYHHDGHLYRSRRRFLERAKGINRTLKDWGAVGYRSGFMLHNYDWHHDLDVLYDASSFDTDPFEPQPDGVGTIFPFWVPREGGAMVGSPGSVSSPPDAVRSAPRTERPISASSHGAGYVELPYTLVQDSTLFLLLRETTTQIWRQKLDWIVEKGGMALLITHPDYMDFGSSAPTSLESTDPAVLANSNPAQPYRGSSSRYPAGLYAEFLRNVRARHGNDAWNMLPRQLATWFSNSVAKCSANPPAMA